MPFEKYNYKVDILPKLLVSVIICFAFAQNKLLSVQCVNFH